MAETPSAPRSKIRPLKAPTSSGKAAMKREPARRPTAPSICPPMPKPTVTVATPLAQSKLTILSSPAPADSPDPPAQDTPVPLGRNPKDRPDRTTAEEPIGRKGPVGREFTERAGQFPVHVSSRMTRRTVSSATSSRPTVTDAKNCGTSIRTGARAATILRCAARSWSAADRIPSASWWAPSVSTHTTDPLHARAPVQFCDNGGDFAGQALPGSEGAGKVEGRHHTGRFETGGLVGFSGGLVQRSVQMAQVVAPADDLRVGPSDRTMQLVCERSTPDSRGDHPADGVGRAADISLEPPSLRQERIAGLLEPYGPHRVAAIEHHAAILTSAIHAIRRSVPGWLIGRPSTRAPAVDGSILLDLGWPFGRRPALRTALHR